MEEKHRGRAGEERKSALKGTGARAQGPTPASQALRPLPGRGGAGRSCARGHRPGSTLLPRLPVPRSPATATQSFCLSDLQLPGYRSAIPYTAAENGAGAAASGREVSSPRPTSHGTVFRPRRLAPAGLGSALGPEAGLSPTAARPIGYWSPGKPELPSPCPHGKCSLR